MFYVLLMKVVVRIAKIKQKTGKDRLKYIKIDFKIIITFLWKIKKY